MVVLDCESRDSTLASIAAIYGLPPTIIDEFLRGFDIDKHLRIDSLCRPSKELLRLFERSLKCQATSLNEVYWFHLTRASSNANFMKNGIQPLSQSLDFVWEAIFNVFRNTSHEAPLRALRQRKTSDDTYDQKLSHPMQGGPFAMLVRESAFRAEEMKNHDYLYLPEIMEDICNKYHKVSGESIYDVLSINLRPYIIKFSSRQQIGKHCIESAIYYLYCETHNRDLSGDANTCYDGNNETVRPEQIVSVTKME